MVVVVVVVGVVIIIIIIIICLFHQSSGGRTMDIRSCCCSCSLINTFPLCFPTLFSMKGLRLLDPSGVVLEQVCSPVRKYLKTREDTVRCIVASLTDDSSNELADVCIDIYIYLPACTSAIITSLVRILNVF